MITESTWVTLRKPGATSLPDGIEHGTLKAIRLGCSCDECLRKRAKMRSRGFYVK